MKIDISVQKHFKRFIPEPKNIVSFANFMVMVNLVGVLALFVYMFAALFQLPTILLIILYMLGMIPIALNIVVWMFILRAFIPCFFEMAMLKFQAMMSGKKLQKAILMIITEAHTVHPKIGNIDDNFTLIKDPETGHSWSYDKRNVYYIAGVPIIFVSEKLGVSYDPELCQVSNRLMELGITTRSQLENYMDTLQQTLFSQNQEDREKAERLLDKFKKRLQTVTNSAINFEELLNFGRNDLHSLKFLMIQYAFQAGYEKGSDVNSTFMKIMPWIVAVGAIALFAVIVVKVIG